MACCVAHISAAYCTGVSLHASFALVQSGQSASLPIRKSIALLSLDEDSIRQEIRLPSANWVAKLNAASSARVSVRSMRVTGQTCMKAANGSSQPGGLGFLNVIFEPSLTVKDTTLAVYGGTTGAGDQKFCGPDCICLGI